MNNFCIKCNNIYKYHQEGDILKKICRVCRFTETAKESDYRVSVELYHKQGDNFQYFLGDIIQDITYPRIEKDGELYTIYTEKDTLYNIYIRHKDGKVFNEI